MFSPETYALLINKINSNSSDISELETSVETLGTSLETLGTSVETLGTSKWGIGSFSTGSSTFISAINTSYDNAENGTVFEGIASTSSWACCWYGLKRTASAFNCAWFIWSDSNETIFGVITRNKTDGTWSFKTLV